MVSFGNKALPETAEELLQVDKQEIDKNNLTTYSNIGVTHMPLENTNKQFVELETDERINKTLDTILSQLDKICCNIKVLLSPNLLTPKVMNERVSLNENNIAKLANFAKNDASSELQSLRLA